jgi:hypothetical protein
MEGDTRAAYHGGKEEFEHSIAKHLLQMECSVSFSTPLSTKSNRVYAL